MSLLQLADQGFFVLHLLLILFNMFGWIWRRTRVAHLVTLGLTTFSWFGLGWWYDKIGFCICTQWHMDVRRALGHVDTESSYLQLLSRYWFGTDMSLDTAYWSSAIVYVLVVLATATVWTIDLTRRWRSKLPTRPLDDADHSLRNAVTAEPPT